MRREQLEHVLRASAQICGEDDIVVVGSQAILGSYPDAPAELLISVEADVYPRSTPHLAELIDGSIGEASPFHATFGYYAHGVGPETVHAPSGWSDRLVPMRNENTRGATGWCLEPHDLVLAKLAAGREKDLLYARDALSTSLVEPAMLSARADGFDDAPTRQTVKALLAALGRQSGP